MYIIVKSLKSDKPYIVREKDFSKDKHIEMNRREAYPEALELLKRYVRMFYCEIGLEDEIKAFDEEFEILSLEKELNKRIIADLRKQHQEIRERIKVMNKLFWNLDKEMER